MVKNGNYEVSQMKKVLIVDDSSLARMMVQKCFKMADQKNEYEVLEASDGMSAIKQLENHEINLVISDLNMPNLGGEDLLKKINSWVGKSDIPVFLISSKINDAKMQELLALGAAAIIKKPLTPTHLIQAFGNLDD